MPTPFIIFIKCSKGIHKVSSSSGALNFQVSSRSQLLYIYTPKDPFQDHQIGAFHHLHQVQVYMKSKGKGNVKQNPGSVPDPKDKLAGEIEKLHAKLENQKSAVQQSEVQSKTSKRKRKREDELRLLLECQNLAAPGKRKRDRKKKYLDAKKKKHKKAKSDDDMDFPQHEKIKFGEVVSAPPKLEFPKKATAEIKIRQDVSQERLRLQAIENYRQRKGWTSRPGSHAPPLEITGLLSET